MSSQNPYQSPVPTYGYANVVANSESQARIRFIRLTYLHLGVAILATMGLIFIAFTFFMPQLMALMPMLSGRFSMLIFFGAFIAVTYGADAWARSATTKPAQYGALGLYIVAEAVFLLPLLLYAEAAMPGVSQTAGIITGMIFVGLTAAVFITGTDFSFLRMYLALGSMAALGIIVASFFFGGITGGVIFPGLMIALASGYILYDTSRIMKHYHTEQYVAASLSLYASVMLLFWYVLRLLLASRR